MPPGTGSLSVITTPAGAAVYIDGVQRGVSPASIPGLSAGSHTVLLKLAGYQDLSTPVSITAGVVNEFSTGMTPLAAAAGTAVPGTTAAGAAPLPAKTQSPGFGTAAALSVIGALILFRKF
jgi:PEGA domain